MFPTLGAAKSVPNRRRTFCTTPPPKPRFFCDWTGTKCDNGHTVLYNVMHDVTNGDAIVDRMLNDCVTETRSDRNDPDYAVVVDLDLLTNR